MKNGNNLIHSFNDTAAQGNFNGLTKREYFAGLAMQGMLSHLGFSMPEFAIGERATAYADELLKQLEINQK